MTFTAQKDVIRAATAGDEEELFDLISDFYIKKFGEMGLGFKKESVMPIIRTLIENHIIFVCTNDGKIVGGIGGVIVPWSFDPNELMFQETAWFVKEENRGSKVFLRLFNVMEDYCKEMGIKYIAMGSLGNYRDNILCNFYSRKGYKHYETLYIKSLGG